jgi:DNA (cytosine-5)-methyltransferase 1
MHKFIDLFAGIGGFHLALNKATFNNCKLLAYSEIDPLCKKIYKHAYDILDNFTNGDIKDLVSGKKDEWGVPNFDICLGGFPCQPFSNVGKRLGINDDRSNVFFDILRTLKYYHPDYFVLENVEKIKTIEKGALLQQMVAELEKIGYKVDIQILCASNYGLPQQRKRIFFCGRKKKKGLIINDLKSPAPILLSNSKFPTTWHLLEKTMPQKHIVPIGSRKTIFTRNEKWMGNLEIDRSIARPICATMGKWHRANQDNYFTENYIMSDNGSKKINFDYLKDPVRRITPLEALRLQGFPDFFINSYEELGISATPAYRTIGNAVPVDLAAAVITNLLLNG